MQLIKTLILMIISVGSWIITFYSGFQIARSVNPEWYHYADAWGFGVLTIPFSILAFIYVYNTFFVDFEDDEKK